MRRISAILAATCLMSAGGWIVAAPAQAAYTSTVEGSVLTLTGTTGDDSASVFCDGGFVEINEVAPSSGPALCSSITSVTVHADAGNDSVFLDGMTEGLFPALSSQSVTGGTGSDQIVAAPVPGTLNGGTEDDRIYPGPGDNTIVGSGGIDVVLILDTMGATLTGTNLTTPGGGSDSLNGVEEAFLTGTGANETFDATAFAGPTNLEGDYGDDTFLVEFGADFVIAGGGGDTVETNAGNDTIAPNDGNDTIDAGPGTDTILLGDSPLTVTNSTASGPFVGSDTFTGIELGTFFVTGKLNAGTFNHPATVNGSDESDTITTGGDKDFVEAHGGNDIVNSKGGNDVVRGELGKDTLNAGPGADVLDGGPQRDICNGGPGPDHFKHCP